MLRRRRGDKPAQVFRTNPRRQEILQTGRKEIYILNDKEESFCNVPFIMFMPSYIQLLFYNLHILYFRLHKIYVPNISCFSSNANDRSLAV